MKTETLNRVFGTVGKIVLVGSLLTLSRLAQAERAKSADDRRTVGYYDAVCAIMETSMLASDKRACIAAMKREAGTDYYRAVIEIAKSSMLGSDKVATIKTL